MLTLRRHASAADLATFLLTMRQDMYRVSISMSASISLGKLLRTKDVDEDGLDLLV